MNCDACLHNSVQITFGNLIALSMHVYATFIVLYSYHIKQNGVHQLINEKNS